MAAPKLPVLQTPTRNKSVRPIGQGKILQTPAVSEVVIVPQGEIQGSNKKPFDILAEGALKQKWLATADAFRTWLQSVDLSELDQIVASINLITGREKDTQ